MNNSNHKVTIEFEDVEKIEIKNYPNSQAEQAEKAELKELTNYQTKLFVDKWNNSNSKGPCKSGIQYWLFVTMKNGSKRTFRATGPIVKENNDWCYNIGEVQFLKNLFANANHIPAEKKKTFELIQGIWFHDQDSLATISINNYQWVFYYEGGQYTADDNYAITITDRLPEFVKETEKGEFIILTNKTDTLQYEILGLTDSTLSVLYFPAGKIHLYRRYKSK